jgi:hypothetical protein
MADRVSRGDGEAVLKASHGGVVVTNHAGTVRGAPADIDVRAAIRPYANSPWDGRTTVQRTGMCWWRPGLFQLMSRILSSRPRTSWPPQQFNSSLTARN